MQPHLVSRCVNLPHLHHHRWQSLVVLSRYGRYIQSEDLHRGLAAISHHIAADRIREAGTAPLLCHRACQAPTLRGNAEMGGSYHYVSLAAPASARWRYAAAGGG